LPTSVALGADWRPILRTQVGYVIYSAYGPESQPSASLCGGGPARRVREMLRRRPESPESYENNICVSPVMSLAVVRQFGCDRLESGIARTSLIGGK
jgi:hypothetical protein